MLRIPFVLTLVLMLAVGRSFGQSHEESKIQIGAYFSPDLNYRAIHNFRKDIWGDRHLDFLKDFETYKFGYTFGFQAKFAIKNRIHIESGLSFSKQGYNTEPIRVTNVIGNDTERVRLFYSLYFLQIPITSKFILIDKKAKFIIGAGVANSFLIGENNYRKTNVTNYKGKVPLPNKGYENKYNLYFTISAGIELFAQKKSSLTLEPTFRYGLVGFDDETIRRNLWNMGMVIGCYYKL